MTRALALALVGSTALCLAVPARADTARNTMPQIYTMTPTGVNLQSGAFVHSETDFTTGSLSFVRSWRAVPTLPVPSSPYHDHQFFGDWNHNYGFMARWHPTRTSGAEVYADGKVYQFVRQQDLSWIPWNIDQHNINAYGTLLTGSIDGNLVFRNQNGDVYTFNANNQATTVDYADGTRLSLTYDTSRRLRTILSSRGDAIVLDYQGPNGLLSAACGFNRASVYVGPTRTCNDSAPNGPQVRVSYGYSSSGQAQANVLTAVTGADGVVTRMTYDNSFRPNLTCITRAGTFAPSGCRITNEFGPSAQNQNYLYDQVRRQTTATGEVWDFEYVNMTEYQDWPPIEFGEIRPTSSTMTGPLSEGVHAEYENGFLKRLTTNQGLTQYSWSGLNPTHFTSPGGNVEILGYDFRNNLSSRRRVPVPGSGESEIQTSAVYPPSVFGLANGWATGCVAASQRVCNKPTSTTDERGNVTDYTYDPAHGGVLTVRRPAVPVRQSNDTIANVRPETRYTYQAISAQVAGSSGPFSESPVWVLTEESECRTTASCTGTSDEVRTVYEYGASGTPNALRLRGRTVTGDGVVARTCYRYDSVGNRISETGPGGAPAPGTPCPA